MSLRRMPTLANLSVLILLSLSYLQLLATPQHSQQQNFVDYDCKLQTFAETQLPRDCGLWYLNKPKLPVPSKLRLSNGNPAKVGQFPSFVKVHFYNKTSGGKRTEWWCGGVIVTQWHILTAAHCTKSHFYSLSNSYVFDPASNKIRYRSGKYCLMENYYEKANWSRVTPYVKNDIAILRVDKPIEFNRLVQPVCLPSVPLEDTPYKEAHVVGLGYLEDTKTSGEVVPDRRSESTCFEHQKHEQKPRAKVNENQILPNVPHMSLMQSVECKSKDKDTSTICFVPKYGGGSICKGDSGGPVYGLDSLNRQVLYGVPSYVDMPCTSSLTHKSVMANVWSLRESIKKLIERC